MESVLSIVTDPWTLGLAQWTLGTIISAIIQLILIPVVLWFVYIAFDVLRDIYEASNKSAIWWLVILLALFIWMIFDF